MSFMILILLSLASLARVEIATNNASLHSVKARQNALLSLSLAAGEIQRNLGPDRRVSARAEILDTNPDEFSEVSGVAHPFWTGVWDDEGNLITWLVNGNRVGVPLQWSALDAELAGDSGTTLVQSNSLTEGEVRVPISDLPDVGGRFAYWVADEGIKAKVNLADSDATLANANLLSAQRFGIPTMDYLDWFSQNDTSLVQRLSFLPQMAFLPDAPTPSGGMDPWSLQFHHITLNSYGVLSNSREGGLKKDLSYGLFDLGASGPTGDMFPHGGGGVPLQPDPGGPAWDQLRSWLQTSLPAGNLPVRPSSDNVAGFYPILSSFRLYMLPSYDPTTRQVNIHLMPSVVLWNPYDTPLTTENYSVKIGRSRAGSTFHHTRNLFFYTQSGVTDVSGGTNHGWLIELKNDASDEDSTSTVPLWNVLEPVVFHIPSVELGPGESKVYSAPEGHNEYTWPSQAANLTHSTNELLPGFRPGWSYYYPLPYEEPLGYLTLDDDGEEWDGFDEYILYQVNQSRIMGLNFSQGTADNPTHLMDIVHLTTGQPIAPPPDRMNHFPELLPFTDEVRNAAVGLFFQRQYTDNAIDVDPSRLRARNQWLAHHNPRAATQGSNPFFYTRPGTGTYGFNNNPSNNPSFIGFVDRFNDNQGITASGDRVPVGLSEDSNNILQTILFSAPPGRAELQSIGQLQHAPLYRWHPFWQSLFTDLARLQERMNRGRYDNLIPAYAIGNSSADPRIPLGEVRVQWPAPSTDPGLWGVDGWHYDYSYLMNENLWDEFFFSTMTDPESVPENRRFHVLPHDSVDNPSGYETSAANLLVNGAFNVNSTSVEAWKALLGSFWNQDVTLANNSTIPGENVSSFLRFELPHGANITNGGPNDPQVYDGFRALDQDQIENLATEIVRQVKLRGPFVSMAAFVNRSLDAADDDLRRSGALADALRRSEVNEALQVSAYQTITTNQAFPGGVFGMDAVTEQGWRTANLPGWLTQADLLSRLGSILAVRSDTFLIRSYGESTNTGGASSSAWAEIVVQRKPSFVGSSSGSGIDPPSTEPEDLSLPINLLFGRSFEVISFRWLDEHEL